MWIPQAQWRSWRIWHMGRSWESWECSVWRRNSPRASYLPLQIPDEGEGDGDRLFSVVHRTRIRDNGHKLKHGRLLLNFLKYFCYESGCTGWPGIFFVCILKIHLDPVLRTQLTQPLSNGPGKQEVPLLQECLLQWAVGCCLKQQWLQSSTNNPIPIFTEEIFVVAQTLSGWKRKFLFKQSFLRVVSSDLLPTDLWISAEYF